MSKDIQLAGEQVRGPAIRVRGPEKSYQDLHVLPDEAFVRLMDSLADAAHPSVARLRELIAERGWTGWTRVAKREP